MPKSYRKTDMPMVQAMYDAVDGFISDCAFGLVPGMEICPSSLDSNGLPVDYSETAHKWCVEYNATLLRNVHVCSECGAIKD